MLTRRFALAVTLSASLLATALLEDVARAADATLSLDKVLDDFVAAVKADAAVPADQQKAAGEIIAALRTDLDGKTVAITEVLRVLHPEFKDALTALGEENLGAAITKLTTLRESKNPYLAADASYFLSRAYLLDERFEDALPLLADLQAKWTGNTTHGGEVLFLQGVAEVAMLRHKEATDTLSKFLALYPDAPERMRVGAFRQLEQLKLFAEGTLSDVSLRMEFSRRKLSLEDTGTETRKEQDKIIEILAKLIKEAEERECNCKGGGSGSGQGKKQGKGGEGDSQAQGQGQGQGGSSGGGSKGTDSDAVKRLHRGGPQSPWSHLRDKDRDPVYSAIKEKFPARYQQLIEQYYKSFNDESEG
jgi:tetratricopeptide (TPR) repeat protein